MEMLSELFNPIPLAAMIAAVFAIVFILVISLIFKMPLDFADRERVRMELRFRLADEKLAAELAEKKEAEAAAQEKPADADADAADAPPEDGKPPETASPQGKT